MNYHYRAFRGVIASEMNKIIEYLKAEVALLRWVRRVKAKVYGAETYFDLSSEPRYES